MQLCVVVKDFETHAAACSFRGQDKGEYKVQNMSFQTSFYYGLSQRWETFPLDSSLSATWLRLYADVGTMVPDRVRVVRVMGSLTQAVYEGTYAGAILWFLGVWDLNSDRRMAVERTIDEALCMAGRKNDGCGGSDETPE